MLDIDRMIQSAEACIGWPYVSPGTNDARGIDCSGLFVKIYKDQNMRIYHGSNTIWRKYCGEKGELKKVSQLKPGMAVFKWNPNTPKKFDDGQGDFQHIGLVCGVNPLRIIHASSEYSQVTTDYRIGKWKYWAYLKDVDYGNGGHIASTPETPAAPVITQDTGTSAADTPVILTATVCADKGKAVKLRARPSTKCSDYDDIPVGTVVTVTSYKPDWCKITYKHRKGWYMMTKFLSFG